MQIEAIKSKDSHTYWIESGDTMYEGRLIHGQYQSTNWDFAQTLVSSWRRCIDIGSNNAVNAIHYAKRFQTVECFEPTPLAQKLWTRTIIDNGVKNCILHTEALGETPRTTDIIIHPRNGGHNHIQHFDKNPRARGTTKRTVTVDVRTLDSYNFDEVDFVKIDVEGMELKVLNGMRQTIASYKPQMLIEMQDPTTYAKTYDFLNGFGYNIYWLPVRTYTEFNHKNNKEDVFGAQHGVINWIASTADLSVKLSGVVDRDDTIERMVYRRSQNG